jgi:hypothetical protein
MFSSTSIDAAVTRALQQVGAPDDHTKAFILTGTTSGGMEAVYVQRFAHGWAITGEFDMTMDRTITAGFGVVWTGK